VALHTFEKSLKDPISSLERNNMYIDNYEKEVMPHILFLI
jgi:hypothetical protein